MVHRIYNFCAGPCTLPTTVLAEVQAELLDFQGSGMSVIEISHRSKRFEALHFETLALAKKLLRVPDEFEALLLPGGAHQQFVMTALNLLADGGRAAFIVSGIWSAKALREAQRIGPAEALWDGAGQDYTTLPANEALPPLAPDSRYVYLASNETVGGVQFRELPTVAAPLVVDASSDFYTRHLDWARCDLVYGGVQKNLAPAGLALVFIRKRLLVEHPKIPQFLSYKAHADAQSLYNTPPTFQIYVLGKMLRWMEAQGGVDHFAAQSRERSARLYAAIDASAFYRNPIPAPFRSQTNVIFNLPSAELESQFWQEAETQGMSGLKGHRVRGGIRASLYNALPGAAVDALLAFMAEFERRHG